MPQSTHPVVDGRRWTVIQASTRAMASMVDRAVSSPPMALATANGESAHTPAAMTAAGVPPIR